MSSSESHSQPLIIQKAPSDTPERRKKASFASTTSEGIPVDPCEDTVTLSRQERELSSFIHDAHSSGTESEDEKVAPRKGYVPPIRLPQRVSYNIQGADTFEGFSETESVPNLTPRIEPLSSFTSSRLRALTGAASALSKRARIPEEEDETLGPIKKWTLYRRFPFKLITKVLLMALLFSNIAVFVEYHNVMELHTMEAFSNLFLGTDPSPGRNLVRDISDIGDAFDQGRNALVSYFNLSRDMSTVYHPVGKQGYSAQVTIEYLTDTSHNNRSFSSITCELKNTTRLGPFHTEPARGKFPNPTQQQICSGKLGKNITSRLHGFSITMPLKTTPPRIVAMSYCIIWTVVVDFRITHGTGNMQMGLTALYNECDCMVDFSSLYYDPTMILVTATIVVAVIDLVLWVKAYRRRASRRKWSMFCVVADVFILVSMVMFTVFEIRPDSYEAAMARWIIFGLGSMLQCFSLPVFLKHQPSLYRLLRALGSSAPALLYFTVEVGPVYMGFALFAVFGFGVFSKYFQDLDYAFSTLFCVFNGDSVDDVLNTSQGAYTKFERVFCRIFIVIFVCLFMYVIINSVRCILTEAYQREKEVDSGEVFDFWEDDDAATDVGGDEESVMPSPRTAPHMIRVQNSARGLPPSSFVRPPRVEGDASSLKPKEDIHFNALRKLAWQILKSPLLMVRILQAIITLTIVLVWKTHMHIPLRQTTSLMQSVFVPPDTISDMDTYNGRIYSLVKAREFIGRSVGLYYDLDKSAPNMIHSLQPPFTRITINKDIDFRTVDECSVYPNSPLQLEDCDIPRNDTDGPFGDTSPCSYGEPKLLGRLITVEVHYHYHTYPNTLLLGCVTWDMMQRFDFSARDGVVPVELLFTYGNCGAVDKFWTKGGLLLIICAAGAVFGAAGVFVVWKTRAKFGLQCTPRWRIMFSVTDVLTILWTVIEYLASAYRHEPNDYITDMRLEFGALVVCLNWIALVGIVELYPHYTALRSTLKEGIPQVFEFLVSALPVFMGYVVFGTVVFGNLSYHFSTTAQAAVTLFAAMNGDSLFGLFETINSPTLSIISRVYMASFVSLFLLFIVNVFFVLFEESFQSFYKQVRAERERATTLTNPASARNRMSARSFRSVPAI